MRKYKFKNAIVYVAKPTQEQIVNLRKQTEIFLKQVMKERIQNGCNRSDKKASVNNTYSRKRDREVKN